MNIKDFLISRNYDNIQNKIAALCFMAFMTSMLVVTFLAPYVFSLFGTTVSRATAFKVEAGTVMFPMMLMMGLIWPRVQAESFRRVVLRVLLTTLFASVLASSLIPVWE
jgi:hypothetical protein